jgi:hypothetical protein
MCQEREERGELRRDSVRTEPRGQAKRSCLIPTRGDLCEENGSLQLDEEKGTNQKASIEVAGIAE